MKQQRIEVKNTLKEFLRNKQHMDFVKYTFPFHNYCQKLREHLIEKQWCIV